MSPRTWTWSPQSSGIHTFCSAIYIISVPQCSSKTTVWNLIDLGIFPLSKRSGFKHEWTDWCVMNVVQVGGTKPIIWHQQLVVVTFKSRNCSVVRLYPHVSFLLLAIEFNERRLKKNGVHMWLSVWTKASLNLCLSRIPAAFRQGNQGGANFC